MSRGMPSNSARIMDTGMSVGPQTAREPDRSIPQEFAGLDKCISLLQEETSRLIQKLSPVLKPVPPDEADNRINPSRPCEMANLINSATVGVSRCLLAIQSANDRLEL